MLEAGLSYVEAGRREADLDREGLREGIQTGREGKGRRQTGRKGKRWRQTRREGGG